MDLDALVADYLLAWGTTDDAERREALQGCWSPDGVYEDPTARVAGRDAFAQHLDGFQGRFPDSRFELASRVDGYGDHFRFAWRLLQDPDGTLLLEGVDIGALDGEGRIASITGFFGPL